MSPSSSARVIRDGQERTLPAEHLVPGDLVVVEAGDRIPADIRLICRVELSVDESAITGESEPVVKDEVVLPHSTPVADRRNMLYLGTLATSGTGVGVVVATGEETELREIHRLVGSADTIATPLTTILTRFSKILTMVILGLAALTFATGIARGQDPVDMFTAAIALAVGMIPEGLPAAVNHFRNWCGTDGQTRSGDPPAARRENVGQHHCDLLGQNRNAHTNQMTVREIWTTDTRYTVSGSGYSPHGDIRPVHEGLLASSALQWTLRGGCCVAMRP
ncbi:MAG TPA: hypothetical protein VGP24_14200 [Glaciihabitans sp.]|nr:hypothetical protein [Glaciihabitans sp.]